MLECCAYSFCDSSLTLTVFFSVEMYNCWCWSASSIELCSLYECLPFQNGSAFLLNEIYNLYSRNVLGSFFFGAIGKNENELQHFKVQKMGDLRNFKMTNEYTQDQAVARRRETTIELTFKLCHVSFLATC